MNKKWREARRIVALALSSLLITALLTVLNPSAANAAPAVTSLSVTSGTTLGATVVTITGTGLTSTTAVTFGGTAGTAITNTSATQISVTTPAHAAGAVDVVVTSGGQTTTVTGGYTYTLATLAPPTSMVVTPNFNVANGYYLSVTFTAASGATTTRAELINNATGSTVGANNFFSSGNSFTGLLPNTSYTVNLYSVGSSGTYTNGQSIAATSTVTTTSAAPAAISWGTITLTVAPSSSTVLAATLSAPATGATYYRYTLYDNSGTFIRVQDTTATSNSFVGLTPATTYKVSVKAFGNGMSYLDTVSDLGPVSGTTATHENTIIGGNDPAAQTHFVIDKIEGALHSLDAKLEDVVRTKVFVSDIQQWEAIARAHGERFAHIQPANTMVEAKLVGDGYLVEIEVDAIVN